MITEEMLKKIANVFNGDDEIVFMSIKQVQI